jgi:hypothetical protein
MFTVLTGCKRTVLMAALVAVILSSIAAAQSPWETHPQAEKHDLYVSSYGVGKYKYPGNDLSWPDQDAETLDSIWAKQEGGLWANVHRTLLPNKKATANAIRADMERMELLAKKGDTAAVNFFMHGTDPKQTGETWLCPYDCDDNDPSTFIPASYVKAWAKRMSDKGVHVVIVAGCCFAGGFNMEADNVLIFMASQANEESWEEPAGLLHGNFYFNKALIEALNGAADFDHDGTITDGELIEYLNKRMPELTKKQTWCCNGGAKKAKDQPLLRVKASEPSKSPLIPLPPHGQSVVPQFSK